MRNRLREEGDNDDILKDLRDVVKDTIGDKGLVINAAVPANVIDGPYSYPRNSEELANKFYDNAVTFYNKDNTEHLPTFFVMSEERQIVMIVTEFMETEEKKSIIAQVFRKIVAMEKAVACVFISEVWMSTPSSLPGGMSYQEYLDSDKFVMPSQDPNRMEAVMVTAEYKDQAVYSVMGVIERDGDGKVVSVKRNLDYDQKKISGLTGRFANILKEGLNEEVSLEGQPEGWEDGGDPGGGGSEWENFA